MSVDFNAMISQATNEAQRRRNIGQSAAFVEAEGFNKSAQAQKEGAELSVGDIANAMKAGRTKRQEDNSFVSTNGKGFKVNRGEKDKELSPMAIQAQEKIVNMQNQITAIQNNADQSLGRQNNIANTLKSYQKDPFAK